MALHTICQACESGDHGSHRRVVQAVPQGMMGGSICTCRGECRDGRYMPERIKGLPDIFPPMSFPLQKEVHPTPTE